MGDGILRSFAAETGKLNWELDCNPPEYRTRRYPRADGPSEILATPVFHDGRIYVAIGQEVDHGEGLGNLVCADARTGRLIWQNQNIHRSISSVVVVGERVYAADFSGYIYGFDAASGRIVWRYDSGAYLWASPLYVDGLLYIGDEDGVAMVFDLERIEELALESNEPLHLTASTLANDSNPPVWETSMHAPLYAQPVFANGVLYLNASPYLVAIAGTGEPLETREARERGRFPDAVYVPTPQDVVERMLELAKQKQPGMIWWWTLDRATDGS
jgi:outer membrane protein assembly factor BamB